ncbi:hypothetical protein AXE65_12645 [Ventosimonas gracilis]|uniref:Uncharacterized protein n=1 Tax=Ventosimonas gracilis TaxID=1680762 RepID=A0A139SW04_9GAMM|nr:NirD/YgiW/YdeI family stress tolerance protein [Ventosimonas gracilis]KXU38650.1 hypothetical protein AXE65_12645 [Ventosimonas gracilis]
MKLKLLLASAVLAASSGLAFAAGYTGPDSGRGHKPASGYTGPSAPGSVTTVAEAMKAADDTPAVLTGYITQRLRKEHYEFKDDSGIIQVEIDNDEWPAQAVSETTQVRLYGEVEHKKRGEREIDVDRVEIVQ